MPKPKQRKATINPANLEEMLRSSSSALTLGQRQWFTPLPYAEAFPALLHKASTIVDLNMGCGNLLRGSTAVNKLGIEIDVDCARKPDGATGNWSCLAGDLTLMAPILEECGWRADSFALNPPFSLPWEAKRLAFLAESPRLTVKESFLKGSKSGRIDSSLATYLLALHFCTQPGEGYIVMNEDTAIRFFGDPTREDYLMHPGCPARQHIWLWLAFDTTIFPETGKELRLAVLYFAADHKRIKPHYVKADALADLPAQLQTLKASRFSLRGGISVHHDWDTNGKTWPYFLSAKEEYRVRHGGKKPEFNIMLDRAGIIRTYLTPFQQISGSIPVELVRELDKLKGQSPLALVVQKATRDALRRAVNSEIWTVDPQLPPLVEKAIRDYNSVRSPFYPLTEIQRIGYVDEFDMLPCRKHGLPGFLPGKSYPLSSKTVEIGRRMHKLNALGETDEIELSGQDLQITITSLDGMEHRFMHMTEMNLPDAGSRYRGRGRVRLPMKGTDEAQADPLLHDLQTLVEYFEIPEVPDIASLRTDEYLANLQAIAALEARACAFTGRTFSYKTFQRDDIARLCLHDGGILSWQAGLGKTLGAITYQLIKGGYLNLIVAPDSLHDQICAEALRFFGIKVKRLMSQGAYFEDEKLQAAQRHLINTGQHIQLGEAHPEPLFYITSYTALGMNGGDEWEPKVAENGDLIFNEQRLAARRETPGFLPEHEANIGAVRNGIKCCWSKTLSTLTHDLFDNVAIDEGVRIKGSDTYIGRGVRQMKPRFRAVLTATPIKNRLEDIFWLCWWVCGGTEEPNPRFPYENSDEARELFANEHTLAERNITKEDKSETTGRRKSYVKRTATICNIHRLWKLLGPIVIRRRKEDIGEDIVEKRIIPIKVKSGAAQQAVYAYHLNNPPEFSQDGVELKVGSQIAVQLNLLRQAALCPDSPNLRLYGGGTQAASWTDFTTKGAAVFGVVAEKLPIGEQVIIMSPFQHASAQLHARLRAAGVNACLLDGNMSPAKRGRVATQFKAQKFSVMVAGIKAMGEGHSFACCRNLIRVSLEWAFDINDQSGDRVHRLDSEKDVNIYDIITANTVEERLAALYHEKGDSANLALDGRLFADRIEEVNLAQLLRDAVRDFDPAAETINEQQIEDEWPALQKKLGLAQAAFDQWHPPIAELPLQVRKSSTNAGMAATQADIAAAIRALAEPPVPAERRNGRREVRQRETARVILPTASDALRALLDEMEDIQMPE